MCNATDSAPRLKVLGIRLQAAEADLIEHVAALNGMAASTYFRRAALERAAEDLRHMVPERSE
jgi:uncharacterized protein (DUF1778 family)